VLVLRELRDAEREPVLTVTTARDDLREHRLRLLVAAVLHELLGEDSTAIEIVVRFLPVLLETREEVFEADGDRTTLLVLHLHRGAVEAEELPDLLHRQRDRTVDDVLLHRLAVRAERDQDHRVAGDAVREGGDRREDRRSALDRNRAFAIGPVVLRSVRHFPRGP
jgi:hypothetical protein